MWISALVSSLLLTIVLFTGSKAASAHIHTHQHNKIEHGERTQDGAYSPKDMGHYADGEHHQEFDHEAIIGTNKIYLLQTF